MSGRLDGQVGIVTGAASGFGRATANRFAEEGARVVIVDLDEPRGAVVVDEVRAAGTDALPRGRRRLDARGRARKR